MAGHFDVADRGCLRHSAGKYDQITMQEGLSSVPEFPTHVLTAWESDAGTHNRGYPLLTCCSHCLVIAWLVLICCLVAAYLLLSHCLVLLHRRSLGIVTGTSRGSASQCAGFHTTSGRTHKISCFTAEIVNRASKHAHIQGYIVYKYVTRCQPSTAPASKCHTQEAHL